MVPSLNKCKSVEDMLSLNKRLVTFTCMVQDMFEEEYFMSVLFRRDAPGDYTQASFYKYFSEISPK